MDKELHSSIKTTYNSNSKTFTRPSSTGRIGSFVWKATVPTARTNFFEELNESHRRAHSDTNLLSINNSNHDSEPSIAVPVNTDPINCPWPQFEEVLELEDNLEQMPPHRLKQFLFLHNIVNSSSDDSQFTDSDTESEEYTFEHPPSTGEEIYHFHMLEVPVPLRSENAMQGNEDPEKHLEIMLTKPKLTFYSVPQSIKHLLCTHDNLMGLTESITLERIVRRRTLAEIIPMSSEGVRSFFPLQVDFSLTDTERKSIVNVGTFIRTLSNKFHQKMGSFFNTTFQFTYNFNCGKFHIKYGIFEDNFELSFGKDFVELHAFSRYLVDRCFESKEKKRPEKSRKAWKSFVTMAEVFNIIDYMLHGKFSWVQNNRRLLRYITRGGSLKVASKQYDQTVRKNQQRILSNVRKYIRNKELMPLEMARERKVKDEAKLEFHSGLYEQIIGFYENIGKDLPRWRTKIYVIELEDLEQVIAKILEKYVYEKYEVTTNDNTFTYKV